MCSEKEVSRANDIAEREQNRQDIERGRELLNSGQVIRYDELQVGDEILGVGRVVDIEITESNYSAGVVDLVVVGAGRVARFPGAKVTIKPRPVDETDAAAYVETSARDLISELRGLRAVAEYQGLLLSDDELDALDLGDAVALQDHPEDRLWADEMAAIDAAEDRLLCLPLAVEATTTFEVVLGVGGPDQQLCFECDGREEHPQFPGGAAAERFYRTVYEVRRVFYVYSWEGSAEIELTGEDRETAEAFGRRVVPELGE